MRFIKITALLKDGRVSVSDGYLPFDGVLYSAYARKYHPELLHTPILEQDSIIDFPLPLQKIVDNKYSYYNCSFAFFEKVAEDTRLFNKRYDTNFSERFVNFGNKRGVVETRKGKFKNARVPLSIILTQKIEWYAVGEMQEVKSLLSYINKIGKKGSQGIGLVKEWIVEEIEQEQCLLLRAIPDPNGLYEMSIQPPYHLKPKVKVIVPDSKELGCNALYEY